MSQGGSIPSRDADWFEENAHMGYTSDITNKLNGKKYLISTAEDKRAGGWQIAVLERKLFGVPNLLHPAMFVGALDEEHARLVHAQVEEIVATLPPAEWQSAKWSLVNGVLDATDVSQPESNADLRALARMGEPARAIMMALARDDSLPLDATDLEAQLASFHEEESRGLVRLGYRVRLAELQVFGERHLVPLGRANEILRSNRSPKEKTGAIAEYLELQNDSELTDPMRLYARAPFDAMQKVFEQLAKKAVDTNRRPNDEIDLQTDLVVRHLAYGYIYKVAEDLVYQSVPRNRAEPGLAIPALERQGPQEQDDGQHWDIFYGKPNTEVLLREKAKVMTSLIELLWDAGLVLAAPFTNTLDSPQVRLGEEEARRVLAETAVFLIRVVDESAFGALSPEERDTFMDELDRCVGRALENKGVELRLFAELLSQRLPEYAQYRRWIPEGEESPKNTLFWEFGKKIGAIVGLEEHAGFNVELSILLLDGVNGWKLPELLRG